MIRGLLRLLGEGRSGMVPLLSPAAPPSSQDGLTYVSALALFKIRNNPTVSSDLLHNATQFRLVSSAVNSTIYFLITQYIFYPNCHSGPQSWENKDKHYRKVYDSLTQRISTSHSLFLAGLLLGVFLLLFGYKYSMQTFN